MAMSVQTSAWRPSRRARKRLADVASLIVMLFFAAFFLFPLVFIIVNSVRGSETAILKSMGGIKAFIPSGFSTAAYKTLFSEIGFWDMLRNTFATTVAVIVASSVVNSMFAYALARFRFRGRRSLLLLVIGLITVPSEALAIPMMVIVNRLPWFGHVGWTDSYQVLIIPFIADVFSIFLFYQFFLGFPDEIEEAARIDGASAARIFWQIAVPLSKPVFATAMIVQLLARWGDLLWPILTIRSQQFSTLALGMQYYVLSTSSESHWGPLCAFAVLSTLPVVILFLVFQRQFIQSVASTGIKG